MKHKEQNVSFFIQITQIVLKKNIFCISESFNTNISHQIFDYKITIVNSHLENTNSKGNFVLKNWFETFVERFLVCKNKSESKI